MTGASSKRWQFSTRSLLLLTAVVSAVLALAVSLPIWFQVMIWAAIPVLIVVALFQSANFLTSDRRPRLATLSWTMLAGFFGFYSAAILSLYFARAPASDEVTSRIMFGVMATCSVICVIRACRSLLHILSGRTNETSGDTGI
jgi:membrane protease YdiL (CAAX protease family)